MPNHRLIKQLDTLNAEFNRRYEMLLNYNEFLQSNNNEVTYGKNYTIFHSPAMDTFRICKMIVHQFEMFIFEYLQSLEKLGSISAYETFVTSIKLYEEAFNKMLFLKGNVDEHGNIQNLSQVEMAYFSPKFIIDLLEDSRVKVENLLKLRAEPEILPRTFSFNTHEILAREYPGTFRL